MYRLSSRARAIILAAFGCDDPKAADARRVRRQVLARLGVCVTLLAILAAACTDDASEDPNSEPDTGAGKSGVAGATSNGGKGGTAGASSTGGSAGKGNVAGNAGSTNNGGAAGSSAGSGGVTSHQGDPGTTGDGVFDQKEPYTAAPETLSRAAGAPEGSVSVSKKYASKLYGYEFEYWIYVPAQYRAEKPAALTVFQDGVHYLGLSEAKFNSKNTFDNLIHKGDMPVTIGLFINPGKQRSIEYDSLDDLYTRFLLEEIIPDVVTSKYNIVNDPDGWAIGGHSSGGICAFTVAWHRPDKFRKVLTHNGSFTNIRGGNAYPQMVRDTSPEKPLRVYLLSGTNDVKNGYGDWFAANGLMAEALASKNYHYRYLKGTGGHYPPVQSVADYPEALRWLWRAYKLPQ
jgi:enterochelin esterase family protein